MKIRRRRIDRCEHRLLVRFFLNVQRGLRILEFVVLAWNAFGFRRNHELSGFSIRSSSRCLYSAIKLEQFDYLEI